MSERADYKLAPDSTDLDPYDPGIQTLSVWDRSAPRSLVNLVPPGIAAGMELAARSVPDFFGLDEHTLYKRLRSEGLTPSITDYRLRMKLWMEYDYAQMNQKRKIDVQRVVAGVCSYDFFEKNVLASPSRVAWITTPPVGYQVKTGEALAYGIEQLREILALDHNLPKGKIDNKLLDTKVKIVNMLHTWEHGAALQKTISINAEVTGNDASKIAARVGSMSMESLNNRLKLLRQRERALMNGGMIAAKEAEEKGRAEIIVESEPAEGAQEDRGVARDGGSGGEEAQGDS